MFLVLFLVFIPEISEQRATLSTFPSLFSKLDIAGLFLLAPAIVMVLLALQYGGNQYSWNSAGMCKSDTLDSDALTYLHHMNAIRLHFFQ